MINNETLLTDIAVKKFDIWTLPINIYRIIHDKRIKVERLECCIRSHGGLYTGKVDYQTVIY